MAYISRAIYFEVAFVGLAIGPMAAFRASGGMAAYLEGSSFIGIRKRFANRLRNLFRAHV